VQVWGHQGDARWGYWAGKNVIVSVEEIVPPEVIRNDPSRTVVPGFKVAAVVHMPYGAHPTGMTGYYDSDYAFNGKAFGGGVMRDRELFKSFLDEWVYGCADHDAYIAHYREKFGDEALEAIRATRGPDVGNGVRYTYNPELRFR
jgi:glutaconate CoA-transferase subunit A